MQINLSGKTALVTCSTSGTGYAAAAMLARAGAAIIVNGASRHVVYRAVACLQGEAEKERVRGAIGDVWKQEWREALVKAWPTVDILVNNIGLYDLTGLASIHGDRWEQDFRNRVGQAVCLARDYLPAMKKANWGRVIFIASESARDMSGEVIRNVFDEAVRELCGETAGTGIGVNAIMPDLGLARGLMGFLTDENQRPRLINDEERAAAALRGTMGSFRRGFATRQELAEAVVCLASEPAPRALRAERIR